MKYKTFYIVLFLSVLLDQAVKYSVTKYIPLRSGFSVIRGLFSITYIRNTGAAFGIFQGNNVLLIAVSSCFIIFLLFYVLRYLKADMFLQAAAALIAGGATGNFLDRISRGYVVDFFDLKYFSVFNAADIMINLGVSLLIIDMLFKGKRKAT
ncbi:MAG: signal peptidase II [Candidatus Margulisiibacteriota bacterium]